jgi:glycosyltransferase involved in cell wall biosynthesis
MENAKAMDLLNQSNLLVLPSQFDGWGAVVNEALMRGTPVICSDMCGAKDLIVSSLQGQVFKSGSVDSLYNAIDKHFENWSKQENNRNSLISWSRCIREDCIAEYLSNILTHVDEGTKRPSPPWTQCTNESEYYSN